MRITPFFALFAVVCGAALAQSQHVSETNIGDAILGRQVFLPTERDRLDANRDRVVDVADLVFHMLRASYLAPSVSFSTYTTDADESHGTVGVRLVFTQAFDTATTLTYVLGGTATYGPKSEGGDYTIAGYDPDTNSGVVQVEAGDTEARIEVDIEDDAVFDEGIETLTFRLTAGVDVDYFLGSLQSHILHVDDNDGFWIASFRLPGGSGEETLALEMTQEDGAFTGRVLADDSLVPTPEPNDANRSGDDGWKMDIYTGSRAFRLEIGPIPVDKALSVFGVDYSRFYVVEVAPGRGKYVYEPGSVFSGVATKTLEPVVERLGRISAKRRFLRRESTGSVILARQPSTVATEEVVLRDVE